MRNNMLALHDMVIGLSRNAWPLFAFSKRIKARLNGANKLVLTGTGKSSYVAARAAETFASLNVPCMFVDATHLVHGSIGYLGATDVLIVLSKSGKTAETLNAIKSVRLAKPGVSIVLLTNNSDYIASRPDGISDLFVLPAIRELSLRKTGFDSAPTTSCLQQACVLDLMATEIADCDEAAFRLNHPGGAICY